MAPPVSGSRRPESRRRKPRHPHAARVDSIGVYQDGVEKPHEEQKGMQLRHRTLQPLSALALPNKNTPAPAPAPPAPQINPNQNDVPAPANQIKVPALKVPRFSKDTATRAAPVERGPCANPLCRVTTCPQWRIGPKGQDFCNACGTHARRYPGTMRDPAASLAAKQLQQPSGGAAAAAKKATNGASAGLGRPPSARRATSDNNLEKTGSGEQQQASSGAAVEGQQAPGAKAKPGPSRLSHMTKPAPALRDSLASDGAHPGSSNTMTGQPSCGLDVLTGLVELQGKRGREEEETEEGQQEAGGSTKRRRSGAARQEEEEEAAAAAAAVAAQKEQVAPLAKRAHKPSTRLIESKETAMLLAQAEQQQATEASLKPAARGKRTWEAAEEEEGEEGDLEGGAGRVQRSNKRGRR